MLVKSPHPNGAELFVLSDSNNNNDVIRFGVNSNGQLVLSLKQGGANQGSVLTTNNVLSALDWSHVAVSLTSNQGGTGTQVTVYVNGVSVATTSTLTAPAGASYTINTFNIGKSDVLADKPLNAQLRDMRVYSNVRSATQIANDVNGVIDSQSTTNLWSAYSFQSASNGRAQLNFGTTTLNGSANVIQQIYSLDNPLAPAVVTQLEGFSANAGFFSNVKVSVTGLQDGASEILRIGSTNIALNGTSNGTFTVTGSDTWRWSLASGVVSFYLQANNADSFATAGQAQSLIRSLSYLNMASNPTRANRQFSVTVEDYAGDVSVARVSSINTSAPDAPTLTLAAAITDGATSSEATSASGILSLASSTSGSNITLVLNRGIATAITKSVVTTGSSQAIVLQPNDITALGDGTINVTATITDEGGNTSSSVTTFVLDTVSPSVPTLSLSTGISNGATSSEAVSASGVITVRGESGATIRAIFTDSANRTVTKIVSNANAIQAISLGSNDLGGASGLQDGTIAVSVTQTDMAGNPQTGSSATISFVLDTAAPTTPTLTLGQGISNGGASRAEALSTSGVLTTTVDTGTANSVLFIRDATRIVTKSFVGSASNQSVVLTQTDLATLTDGAITVVVRSSDVAGNVSLATTTFTLDTVSPVVSSVTISGSRSDLQPTLALGVGDNIRVSLVTSEQVTVTSSSYVITLGSGQQRVANYVSGNGTAQNPLVFSYTVVAGDSLSASGVTASGDALVGLLTDAAGNVAYNPAVPLVNNGTNALTVTTVGADITPPSAVTAYLSGGASNGYLKAGSVVTATVLMSEITTVTGTPRLSLNIGGTSVTANYASGSGSIRLNFTYTILNTDSNDSDGISIPANGLALNSGTLRDGAGNNATLTFVAVADNPNYVVDLVAPIPPSLMLGDGVANGASGSEAIQTNGVVSLTAEANATVNVVFSNGAAHIVTKTIIATGVKQAVNLIAGDLLTLTDGTISVVATATDLANNVGTAATTTFVLDTMAPNAPSLTSLVANGATQAKLVSTSGVVTVSAENNSVVNIVFNRASLSVTKTVTATGSAQTLTLNNNDVLGFTDGLVLVTATATDLVGNVSASGSVSFAYDTTPPVAPSLALGVGVANGATSAEAVQSSGVIVATAESGSTVTAVFTRATSAVTKTVTGSGTSKAIALLSTDLSTLGDGEITVSVSQTDIAGNPQTVPNATTTFTLDTTAPTAPQITLISSVANGGATSMEAVSTGGLLGVSAENGSTVRVVFSRTNGGSVTKSFLAGASATSVSLLPSDLTTLGDGTIAITVTAMDVAGNVSNATSNTFILDTMPPSAPTLALVSGISNGASSSEAIATAGVVTFSAELNSKVTLVISRDASHTLTKSFTATGTAQSVSLQQADVSALGDGLISVVATATDNAGNISLVSNTNFVLDTTIGAVDLSATTVGIQNTANVSYSGSSAGNAVTVFGAVSAPTDADIAQINIAVGGISDTTYDTLLLLGSGVSKILNTTSSSGVTNITLGGVGVGINWSYDATAKLFTLSKTSGSVFTSAQVQDIERLLQFQTDAGARQGDRTFALSHIDLAGNISTPGIVTMTVSTQTLVVDLSSNPASTTLGYRQGPAHALNLGNSNTAAYAVLPSVTTTGDFTIEAWVNVSTLPSQYNHIVGMGTLTSGALSPSNNNLILGLNNQGKLLLNVYSGSTEILKLEQSTVFNTNTWVHVAGVVSGSGSSYTGTLYVNGVSVATGGLTSGLQASAFTAFNAATARTTWIGRSPWSGDTYFSGQVQNVMIYDSARSATQVGNDMNTGIADTTGNALRADYTFVGGANGRYWDSSLSTPALSTSTPATLNGGARVAPASTRTSVIYWLNDFMSPATVNSQNPSASISSVKVTVSGLEDNTSERFIIGTTELRADGSGTGAGAALPSGVSVGSDTWDIAYLNNVFTISLRPQGGAGAGASVAQAQNLIRALAYRNVSSTPTQGNRNFAIVVTDLSGNVSPAAVAVIDTLPPTTSVLLGSGVANGATSSEAVSENGVILVNTESDSTIHARFARDSSHVVTKTILGLGYLQGISLSSADVATLGDGTVSVSVVTTDAVGNVASAVTTTFVLDTTPPIAATLALKNNVSTGATGYFKSTDSLSSNGVVSVTGETGSSISVVLTRDAVHSVTKTFIGTGLAQNVILNNSDLSTGLGFTNASGVGTIAVSVTQTDMAGNMQTASANTANFVIDDVTPAVSSVSILSAVGIQNNYLKEDSIVTAAVNFNKAVTLSGSPSLSLNIAGSNAFSTYVKPQMIQMTNGGGIVRYDNFTIGSGGVLTTQVWANVGTLTPNILNTIYTLYGGSDSNPNSLLIFFDVAGRLAVNMVAGSAGSGNTLYANYRTPLAYPVSGWHQYSVSIDASNTFTLYVDGSPVVLQDSNNTTAATFTSKNLGNIRFASSILYGIRLGAANATGNATTNMSVADVRVWDTALTQSAIQAQMNTSLLGNESNLQVYLPFLGVAGTNTLNLSNAVISPNVSHAQISGGAISSTNSTLNLFPGNQALFVYTIVDIQNDSDGIAIGATSTSALTGTTAIDTAGNRSTSLTFNSVSDNPNYKVDTLPPSSATLTLSATGSGVSLNTATSSGWLSVGSESGATIVATFSVGETSFTKIITAVGLSTSLTLSTSDISQLGNGFITVAVRQTDIAGNVQTGNAASTTFLLDSFIAPVDLDSVQVGDQTTADINYAGFEIGTAKLLFPNIASATDNDDIARLTITAGGALDTRFDKIAMGNPNAQTGIVTSQSLGESGSGTVSFGVGGDLVLADYTYNSTSKTLILTKANGGTFSNTQVLTIERGLSFLISDPSVNLGNRTFTLTRTDVVGNVSPSGIETVRVTTGNINLDLDTSNNLNPSYLQSPLRALTLNNTAGGSAVTSGDYVSLPSVTLGGNLTLEAWVSVHNNPAHDSSASIIDIGNSATDRLALGISSTATGQTQLRFIVANGAQTAIATTNITTGSSVWHHVAVVYNQTSNTPTLYVDGIAQSAATTGTFGSIANKVWSNVYIGKSNRSTDPFLSGLVRQVAVYNSALSVSDVAYDANFGLNSNSSGLLFSRKFDSLDTGSISLQSNARLVTVGNTGVSSVTGLGGISYGLDNWSAPAVVANVANAASTIANITVAVQANAIPDGASENFRIGTALLRVDGSGVSNGTVNNGIDTWSYNFSSGSAGGLGIYTFSYTGGATYTQAQEFIRRLQYVNTAATPTPADKLFYITVQDTQGNVSRTVLSRIDNLPPNSSPIVLGTGVANGASRAEALQSSGVVTVVTESGTTGSVIFTRDASHRVTKSFLGDGSVQSVVLTTSDLINLGDGTIAVSSSQTDGVGNVSATASNQFNLLTVIPPQPTLTLVSGISNGASLTEATGSEGVVTINNTGAPVGSRVSVVFSRDASHTVTKILTGIASSHVVTLQLSDITALTDGLITVSATVIDAVDNVSTVSTASFNLDTTIALPTIVWRTGYSDGVFSDGVSSAEATSSLGMITVNSENGGTVSVVFRRDSSRIVTKTLASNGTQQAISLTASEINALGDGSITVSLVATDAVGNSTQSFLSTDNSGNTLLQKMLVNGATVVTMVTDSSSGFVHTVPVNSFILKSIVPVAPVLELGSGVSNGATSGEATSTGGVVVVTAVSGLPVNVVFASLNQHVVNKSFVSSATQTIITLSQTDLAALGGTRVDIVATQTDTSNVVSSAGVSNFAFYSASTTVNSTNGSTVTVVFSDNFGVNMLTKTFVSAGTSQLVTLSASELATLTSISNSTVNVTASVGGVTTGVTATSLSQVSGGIVTISAASGNNVSVTFSDTDDFKVTKILTGSGVSQAVILASADLTTLGDGGVSVIAATVDDVGNMGIVTTNFVLDTIPPNTPSITLAAGCLAGGHFGGGSLCKRCAICH